MPLPSSSSNIKAPPLRDEVYNTLLSWIMEGVLQPGEKLLDKELANHLGISRTPVREALRRLEDKDLVESAANRWTRVSPIPDEEPQQLYPIIWTLEGLAVSMAIEKLQESDFRKMTAANIALEKAFQNRDPIAASKADTDFHHVFIACSQNQHLINILGDLKIRYRRLEVNYFKGISYIQKTLKEHETLMEALKKRDQERAIETIRINWRNSLDRLSITKEKENHDRLND